MKAKKKSVKRADPEYRELQRYLLRLYRKSPDLYHANQQNFSKGPWGHLFQKFCEKTVNSTKSVEYIVPELNNKQWDELLFKQGAFEANRRFCKIIKRFPNILARKAAAA